MVSDLPEAAQLVELGSTLKSTELRPHVLPTMLPHCRPRGAWDGFTPPESLWPEGTGQGLSSDLPGPRAP